jgi:hypothetical protein
MREPRAVSDFLDELDQALSGRRRWRDEVMTEIHAHLLDAVDAAGGDLEDVRRVMERFGDPRAIAQGLNELDAHSRRLRRVMVVVGSSAATAVAAVAVLTMSSTERPGGLASDPASRALIGRVVAVTPAASKIRLRSPADASYSLIPAR